MATADTLSSVIKNRRSIYPASYSEQPITTEEINQVLEAAHWAPNHRRTEPWRFVVMHSLESRKMVGTEIAEYYKRNIEDESLFSELQYQKPIINACKAGCIIAIVIHPDPLRRVPHWEEICAVACATQNMWLTCTALGIGAYWSTHQIIGMLNDKLGLEEDDKVIGLFYMGHIHEAPPSGARGNLSEKVRFL